MAGAESTWEDEEGRDEDAVLFYWLPALAAPKTYLFA